MQSAYQEKRQNTRLSVAVPLRYQIRGTQKFGNTLTKNISSGGLGFLADRFIKPQTHLMLDVNLLTKNINSIANVKWAGYLSHSDKYQIGLEFIGIEPGDRNYISDYIDLSLHKQAI